ncbi:ABC transporter permease [Micromonospora zhanjiangensis]
MSALLLLSATPRTPDRYAAAAVLVRSPAAAPDTDTFRESRPWSPEQAADLVTRLGALPGVAAAVPDRSFYVQAVRDGRPVGAPEPGVPQGHGWASLGLSPYRLVAGTAPERADQVVVDRGLGLRPGDRVTLLTAAGPTPYTVCGTTDGPGFHLSDAAAAGLAPGVRVIGLVLRPDARAGEVAAAARSVVGDAGTVLSGAARAETEPRSDARTRWIGLQVLTAVAALTGFVSIFVVAATFAFAVSGRRREVGLLRAVGATGRQVRRMLYAEAAVIAVGAGALGAPVGAVLATVLGDVLVDVGIEPAGFTVRLPLWPPAVAVAGGVLVGLLGAASTARRMSRTSPLAALRTAAVDERPLGRARWITGGLATAGGLGLAVAHVGGDLRDLATSSLYAAMALIVGLSLLAPVVVGPVVRAVCRPLRRLPGGGATVLLARGNVLANPRRTASTAAPVLLTVGFAVLVTGLVQTSAGAYAAGRGARSGAAAVLVPDGTPGLSDAAVAAVSGAALLPTVGYVGTRPVTAAGMDPHRPRGGIEVTEGGLAGPGGVAVAAGTAARLGWRTGTVATVTFADGRATELRVTALVADGTAPAELLLDRATVRAHDPSALTEAVLLTGGPAGPVPPELGARVTDVGAWAAARDAEDDRLVWIFTVLLIAVSAGYAAIAVANTLLMATAARRADLRVLRLSGATTAQVLRPVAVESALVVAIGTGLGLLVSLPALLGMRAGLAEQVGTAVPLVVPWPVPLSVVGVCLLLALLASVPPARLALR